MGTVMTIDARKLAGSLIKEAERVRGAMPNAAIAAARKFRALLVKRTDELGVTDLGQLKNSWQAQRTSEGATVFSDCPYAGIIELGARPHPVSVEGQQAIAQWAIRKLEVDPAEAKSVAFLIARKIAKTGQPPKYLVQGVLPQASVYFAQELSRILKEAHK